MSNQVSFRTDELKGLPVRMNVRPVLFCFQFTIPLSHITVFAITASQNIIPLLTGGVSVFGIAVDMGILTIVTALLVAAAGWIYPRIAI